jgi:hypothetical protein
VAVGVWIGLSSSGSSSNSLLTSENVGDNGPDQDLVATLLALRAVKLDGSIFTDPAFPEPQGFLHSR